MRYPLLQRAKTVRILTVTNEKVFDASRATYELATHLSRHGINVSVDEIDAGGRDVGTVMEQFVAGNKIDLMVMGAYGHSRFREFVLGGATKSIAVEAPGIRSSLALIVSVSGVSNDDIIRSHYGYGYRYRRRRV